MTQNTRINLAYFTSCREVGLDEQIGRVVIDPVNGVNHGYREGNLESMARLLQQDNEFSRHFNLTAIVVDDDREQFDRAWNQAELWPRNLHVPIRNDALEMIESSTLDGLTIRIPSQPWRSIRTKRDGEIVPELVELKARTKSLYEQEIVSALRERNVDLVVTDSYLPIISDMLLNVFPQRILNIHPAITQVGHPARLPGLFPTRDAYTRAVHGYIIVDDKHAVDIPDGPHITVEFEGRPRIAVAGERIATTGATVHIDTARVDNGPVVMYTAYDFDPHGITREAIRTRTYVVKRELLPQALLQYRAEHGKQMFGRYVLAQTPAVVQDRGYGGYTGHCTKGWAR